MQTDLTDRSHATSAPVAAGPAPADHERLRAIAAQFESLLLGQMMKEMRSSVLGEDDKESGFGESPLASAMYSELSLALSRAGGIGIAQTMLGPLLQQAGGGAAHVELPPISLPDPGTGAIPGLDAGVAAASAQARVKSAYGWSLTPATGPVDIGWVAPK